MFDLTSFESDRHDYKPNLEVIQEFDVNLIANFLCYISC